MFRSMFMILFVSLVSLVKAQDKVVVDPMAEERRVDAFHSIAVAGSIELWVSQGESRVAVSASEKEFVEGVETVVENGILQIRPSKEEKWWKTARKYARNIRVYVSAPEIRLISLAGSGSVEISGTLKGDALVLQSAGSGNIAGKVDVDELEVRQSGSGNVRIRGVAVKGDLQGSGSGNFACPDLVMEECVISMSGTGNAEFTVNKSLDASTSGTGNIRYRGDADKVRTRVSGLGSIRKI